MAANYENTVVLHGERVELLLDAVVKLAACKGWRVEKRRSHEIVCLVPVNLWSWGERLRVVADPHSVRVISRCRFPLQVIDWGKNERNVEAVLDSLIRAKRAGAEQAAEADERRARSGRML